MRSGDVAPRMSVTLSVEECLGVGQRAQDGLAVRLVGNGIESGLQPVREVTGRPFGGQGFDAYKLQYHTFGIRAGHAKLPVQAWLNYTLTHEEEGRKLENDRIELLGQVTF